MSEAVKVTVGGNERVLARFRSYKVTLALDVLGGVTDQVRELLEKVAEARRTYARENPVRITRQLCMERASELKQLAEQTSREASAEQDPEKLQDLEGQAHMLTARAEMYERQLADMGDKEFIEQPGIMPQDQEILVALPEALKMKKQFTQLIGLALIQDEDLQQGWIDDTVFDILLDKGQQFLFEMEVGEEVELIAAARNMLEEQLRPRKGALETIRGLRDLWSPKATEKDEEDEGSENGDSPTSSTPSEAPTDGAQTKSSSPEPEASPTS
jgi:hypothetical protein